MFGPSERVLDALRNKYTEGTRVELVYMDDPYNRKVIGDFACYLVFINSVNAR